MLRENSVLVFRNLDGGVSKRCFGVSKRCFGVSKTVFRNSVSNWMVVFRNMDGDEWVFRVVFRNSVSKWMVVFRCFETVFPRGWWCFGMDGDE